MKGAAALLPLPLACAAGAVVARIWYARTPASFARDIAQPLPVVTAWGAFGAIGFAILAVTLAVATVALVVAARGRRAETSAVVAIAAAALTANLAWPAVFSSDVYAYAAYGDLAARGFDPYLLLPARVHDGFLDAARVQWSGPFPVCVYGPAFVAFARAAVALAGGFGVAATLAVLRGCACAAFLASIALLGFALRDRTPERRSLALYAYGLNPVVLWSVAEGHNDAFLLLAAVAAFALARSRNAATGAFALALGPLIKAPGALLALVYATRWGWIERDRARHVWLAFGIGTALAAALTLPSLLPALTRVGRHGVYAPAVSLQALIGGLPAALVAAGLLCNGARLIWTRDTRGYAWAGLALVAALPNVYPWYALWLVPLALAAGLSGASAALWGATIFAVARYLPDAAGNMSVDTARLTSAVAALPFALVLADFYPALLRRKTTTPP